MDNPLEIDAAEPDAIRHLKSHANRLDSGDPSGKG
jgi:hypothetical protein